MKNSIHEQVTQGQGFDIFEAGPHNSWSDYRLAPPETPFPVRGKYFLKNLLKSEGLEMSINVLPPGKGMPFVHRHTMNDEIYFIIQGTGQFQLGNEVLDVSDGFFLRVSPEVPRCWRNHSDEPLYFLVIQYNVESRIAGGTSDGEIVDQQIIWKQGPQDESTLRP
ncbi:cupin domain-containing protein [Gimesia aquarii]|uniref:Cupin domain protein n=1 Tax=Gimesia aquarii TaxID=2527964 RepID=A0A517X302_9PLAN|nr:cupin domain-containing protein [Gimesia aquarii]QDU11883.1 Cupin domain protein [Gimesia aquarii]